MARIRAVKIGFFLNEHLTALSPAHRLLFQGLWLIADRAGRLEDRPRRIKAQLFPWDDFDIHAMLNDLAEGEEPFIDRYVVDGRSYIEVRHFLRHQRPHPQESPSEIPEKPKGIEKPCNLTAEPLKGDTRQLKGDDEPGGNGNGNGNGDGSGKGTDYAPDGATARVTVEPAAAPVWRKAGQRAAPLIDGLSARRHGSHAWCSLPREGLCVPAFLHAEFLGKSAKSDAELRAWYAVTLAAFEGVSVGDDSLRFWRNHFAGWIGPVTEAPPNVSTREGRNLAAQQRTLAAIERGEL